jgi:hypothetical protein
MITPNNIEERLWGFIDGQVSAEEKSVIEKLLETDKVWNKTYHQLLEVNELLKSSALDAPSLRFTKNVMEKIAALQITPATKTYLNNKIIWGLGIFFITLVVGFLVYGFAQMDWSTVNTSDTISRNIPKLDFSKFFNNTLVNAFMMINVVLGLFLLDNFLTNKRKAFRKEA